MAVLAGRLTGRKKGSIMTVKKRFWCVLVMALCGMCAGGFAADDELPGKPPGKYFGLSPKEHEGAKSFASGQPIVGTTYFYWYDIDSKSHIIDDDGTDALTTHPADMNGISYNRAAWHKRQLSDMIDAGVDFLMPVFWGVPGKYDGWSFAGLGPMVEAHSELEKEGLKPPQIGLFYDTSILQWNSFRRDGKGNYHVDLSEDFGKDWFYTAMRDFFSYIPPAKWARVDGRPIVFLYDAAFAKGQDEGQLAYVKNRFRKDFGVEPFIVKSPGWRGQADAIYSWGGAVSGPLIYRQVIALGPGYDHSAVPGRSPLIVKRLDGKTYIDRWKKVLQLSPASRPWMVHVETWNEWHEGTDVADSREYGRLYIELTKLFSDFWHTRTHLQLPSPYGAGNAVCWQPDKAEGLELRASSGDGVWEAKRFGEVGAVVSAVNPQLQAGRYIYFNIDDAFAFDLYDKTVVVQVTYRDAGCSSFCLEYDSSNPSEGLFEGAFRPVGNVEVGNGGQWKTARFVLPQCRFMNRSNGADFRIAVVGGDLAMAVSKVKLESPSK
jgi:hypothetical protein